MSAMPKRQSPAQMQRACDRFNERHKVSDTVRVWRGIRERPGEPPEPNELVQIAAAAYVLGGHTAVVHVTGGRGCVALTHVEAQS